MDSSFQCHWVIGGTDHPVPAFDWIPPPVPEGVDVRHAADGETVERDYYRRTGIFPQMHIVAVRREMAERTDVLKSVYRAFCEAKELIQQRYRQAALKQHMSVITPWFSKHFDENRMLLGEDWWPYGLGANRNAVDTFLRYHYEQGLSKRLLTSEDIFVPAFLDT